MDSSNYQPTAPPQTDPQLSQSQIKLLEELSEELKCHICLELFEDPRQLACGHTFCLSCTEQLAKGRNIQCPVCRETSKLPSNGVKGLNKNRYVANIIEKVQQAHNNNNVNREPVQSAPAIPYPYNLYYNNVINNNNPPMDTQVNNSAPISYPSLENSNSPYFPMPSAPPLEDSSNQNTSPATYPSTQSASSPPQPVPQQQVPTPQTNNNNSQEDGIFGSLWKFITGGPTSTITSSTQDPGAPPVLYAPFTVQLQQTQPIFVKWMEGLWFTPSDIKDKLQLSAMEAVYVPFWAFEVATSTVYSGQCCHVHVHSDTKKKTEQWKEGRGTYTGYYGSMLVCADSQIAPDYLELISSFHDWSLAKANLRAPGSCGNGINPGVHPAGTQTQAWEKASNSIIEKENARCQTRLKAETQVERISDFRISVNFTKIQAKLVYLPLYMSTYCYEKQHYNYVISGQTGAVQGKRPYGLGKLGALGKSGVDLLAGFVFGTKK